MLRVLAITSLYPSSATPRTSSFNRQQFAALADLCELEIWGTVPWLPLAPRLAPRSLAARTARVPRFEEVAGQAVEHPRTLHLPIVGRNVAGWLYAGSLWRKLRRRRTDFDVLLATWAYPDGFAATLLGGRLGLPTVVKVHGTDLNGLADRPMVRAQLRRAFPRAAAVVAVSEPLAARARALGASPVHVVQNGVDADRFSIRDKRAARNALGMAGDAEVVLFVGNLKREKGIFDLLDAFESVRRERRGAALVVVGGGPDAEAVATRASEIDDVTLMGAINHDQVPIAMAACDVLALPSWSEGTPNVILEAHACGRPVVASAVGGIPDLLGDEGLGAMVPARDVERLARALSDTLAAPRNPAAIRTAANTIDWPTSAGQLHAILADAVRR